MHDVAIVGAGPAGSALAIELANDGLDLLLIDAARFPRDKACGDFVSPRGLAALERLGCAAAVGRTNCQPIRRSRLYLNRDLLVSGQLPRMPGLPDHGLAIPRRELDDLLFRRAVESGALPLEATRITGFETSDDGVELIAERGARRQRIRARMIVGADGANSAVARAAGLAMSDPRYTLASLRAYVHGLSVDHTLMYFDERFFPGYGWLFPVRPGLCNIGVGMVKETLLRSGAKLKAFYALFRRVVQKLARAHGARIEVTPHRGWPIRSYGGARRNFFDRGLLIGEAGAFVDPINGEGIPLAFETARLAARVIRQAFRAGRFGPEELGRYEREWRASLDPDLNISDLVVSMIRNQHLTPLWLTAFRTMSLTAARDPRYAAITGGILGGAVPAREGISPEMFLRSLVHTPRFWREVHRIGPGFAWRDWQARATELRDWSASLREAAHEDEPWFRAWGQEVARKQLRLLRS